MDDIVRPELLRTMDIMAIVLEETRGKQTTFY